MKQKYAVKTCLLKVIWSTSNLTEQLLTTSNNMHATKCSKARNMLGPKMLDVVGQQVCIYMGLKIEPSNNKTCLNPGLLFNSVVP